MITARSESLDQNILIIRQVLNSRVKNIEDA